MTTLSLRLPDSVHNKIKELVKKDHISINQFLATAAAEKMAALMTIDYLEERAKKGDLEKFNRILKKVPSRKPSPGDEILKAR